MTAPLAGKVALVTGGASGMGRATVLALAEAGASVAVLDRSAPGVTSVTEAIAKAGGQSLAVVLDLADLSALASTVERVVAEFGRIDILVNCAGIYSPVGLLEMDQETWDQIHTVDLKAPMFLMQHVARHMIARGGGGRIVNVGSSAAYRARHAPPAYATAKAALGQLTRSAAAELGPYDINVNIVVPGVTVSGLTEAVGPEFLQNAVSSGGMENLFHRVSQPEDVAAAVLFLCLPGSRQITGQAIHTSAGNIV
jgi:NAD(P)-dependent dehydrogenase (short-subunit alcohol dehydrogenase family)